MGLDGSYLEGQTPLDVDEREGLLISTIATRMELNEFEQQNIEQAMQWSIGRSFHPTTVFSQDFLCGLHQRMYSDVWSWAGEFRKTNKNIGVDKWKIATELKYLLDDVNYWYENNIYPFDELTLRFKHRLVSIHCFPNGNGRHSRLVADILIERVFKQPLFSWGSSKIKEPSEQRTSYLLALKEADKGDIHPLMEFARS